MTSMPVLERRRGIGILCAADARGKDVARLFLAETTPTGLAGGLGVGLRASRLDPVDALRDE